MYQFFEEGRESQEEGGQSRQHVDVYAGLKTTFRSEENEKTKLALIQESILTIESRADSEEGGYRLDLYEQAVYEHDLSFQSDIHTFFKCASSEMDYRARPTVLSAYLLSLVNVKATHFFRRPVFENWLKLIQKFEDVPCLDNRLLKLLNAAISTSLAREDRLHEVKSELHYVISTLHAYGWRSFDKAALSSDTASLVSPLKALSEFLSLSDLESYFEKEMHHPNRVGFNRVRGEKGESWICDFLSSLFGICLRTADGNGSLVLIKSIGTAIRDGANLFESESEFFYYLHPSSKANHVLIQYCLEMLALVEQDKWASEKKVLTLMGEFFSENEKNDWSNMHSVIQRVIDHIDLFDKYSLYALTHHLLYNLNVRFQLPDVRLNVEIFSTLIEAIVARVQERNWLPTLMPLLSYYYYVLENSDWSTPRHEASRSQQFISVFQQAVAPLFSEFTDDMMAIINQNYQMELHRYDYRLLYAKYHAVLQDRVIKLREVEIEKITAYVAFHFLCQRVFKLSFTPFDFSESFAMGEATSQKTFNFEILRGNLCNYAIILRSASLTHLLLKLGVFPASFQNNLLFNGIYFQNNNLIEYFADMVYDALSIKEMAFSVLPLFKQAFDLGLFTASEVLPYFTFAKYREMERRFHAQCDQIVQAAGVSLSALQMTSPETRMLLFIQAISVMGACQTAPALKEWIVPFYDYLQARLKLILKSADAALIEAFMECLYQVNPACLVQGDNAFLGNILSLIVNEPQMFDQERRRRILSLLFIQILRLENVVIPISIYKLCFEGPKAVFAEISNDNTTLESFFEKGLQSHQVFEKTLSPFMLQFLFKHSVKLSGLAFKVLSHYRNQLLSLSLSKGYTNEQAFLDSLSLFAKSFSVWPQRKDELFSEEILQKLKEAFSNYKVKRALPRSKKTPKQVNYETFDLGKVLHAALLKFLSPEQAALKDDGVSSPSHQACALRSGEEATSSLVLEPVEAEKVTTVDSASAAASFCSAPAPVVVPTVPSSFKELMTREKAEAPAASSRQTKEDKLYALCLTGEWRELQKYINTREENRELWKQVEARYPLGKQHPLCVLLKRKDLSGMDKRAVKLLLGCFDLPRLTDQFSEPLICAWDQKSQGIFKAAYEECQKAYARQHTDKKAKKVVRVAEPTVIPCQASLPASSQGTMSDERAIDGMLDGYGTVPDLQPFLSIFARRDQRRLSVFETLCSGVSEEADSSAENLPTG